MCEYDGVHLFVSRVQRLAFLSEPKVKMPTLTRGEPGKSRFSNRNISHQAYSMVQGILWGRSSFNNYRNARNENYLLIDNNNKKVLGFAFLAHPKYNSSRISLIGTLPGKGYGKQIMNQIYKNAKVKGRKKVIVLNAVGEAQNFYRARGYKPRPNTSKNTYGRLFNKSVSAMPRKRSPRRSVSPTSKRRKTPSPIRQSPSSASNRT